MTYWDRNRLSKGGPGSGPHAVYTQKHIVAVLAEFKKHNGDLFSAENRPQSIQRTAKSLKLSSKEVRSIVMDHVLSEASDE